MTSKTTSQMMTVAGIGIDIQHIRQLEQAIERQGERLITKVFTPEERDYCQSRPHAAQHYAARWAVKEAFYKAVSEQISSPYRFVDVETKLTPRGKPTLVLHHSIGEFAMRHKLHFHISLSHSGDYATGIVMAVRQADEDGEGSKIHEGETAADSCQSWIGDGMLS